jgi:hypothetical protein
VVFRAVLHRVGRFREEDCRIRPFWYFSSLRGVSSFLSSSFSFRSSLLPTPLSLSSFFLSFPSTPRSPFLNLSPSLSLPSDTYRYAGLILAYDLSPTTKILAIFAPAYLGVIVTIVFGIYWCRKMNEQELHFSDGLIEVFPPSHLLSFSPFSLSPISSPSLLSPLFSLSPLSSPLSSLFSSPLPSL